MITRFHFPPTPFVFIVWLVKRESVQRQVGEFNFRARSHESTDVMKQRGMYIPLRTGCSGNVSVCVCGRDCFDELC